MQNYEAPELTLIGEANEVVMGASGDGLDLPHEFAMELNSSRTKHGSRTGEGGWSSFRSTSVQRVTMTMTPALVLMQLRNNAEGVR